MLNGLIAGNDATKRIFESIGRHFVTLSCNYRFPGNRTPTARSRVISGFIVEIEDFWFYITAGHVLEVIQSDIRNGVILDSWRLSDQTAGNNFQHAIPYDFNIDRWIVLRDDSIGLDYAAVPLERLIGENLRAGGVVALDREAWQPIAIDECDQMVLLGVPKETVVNEQPGIVTGKVTLIPLNRVEPPSESGDTKMNMFFAELLLGSESSPVKLSDVDGMSGGPIFGTKQSNGVARYWLIGVQSGWYRGRKIISACPASSFMLALEDLLREIARPSGN